MSGTNITAVINAHNEGLLAYPSLKSLTEAVRQAENRGLTVQVSAVLDRPDTLTSEVFESYAKDHPIEITVVDYADSGLSRNAGVQSANGKWVAFLDADDMWGSNWLWAAHQCAEHDTRAVIWHPEVNVYLGSPPHLFLHVDMDGEKYDPSFLAYTNYWTALCFVKRDVVAQIPYSRTQMDRQIGHEDWGWNMEAIAQGVIHKVAPRTAHVIRVKNVSVLKRASAAGCLPRPSNMFRQILTRRLAGHSNTER